MTVRPVKLVRVLRESGWGDDFRTLESGGKQSPDFDNYSGIVVLVHGNEVHLGKVDLYTLCYLYRGEFKQVMPPDMYEAFDNLIAYENAMAPNERQGCGTHPDDLKYRDVFKEAGCLNGLALVFDECLLKHYRVTPWEED